MSGNLKFKLITYGECYVLQSLILFPGSQNVKNLLLAGTLQRRQVDVEETQFKSLMVIANNYYKAFKLKFQAEKVFIILIYFEIIFFCSVKTFEKEN